MHPSKIVLVALALALTGCANINPFSKANTLEQKSYALYGSFVIFEEQGARMIRSGEVPNRVKAAIQSADQVAKPVADNLKEAADTVIDIKRELEAGMSDKDKLRIAVNNLSEWYYVAKPKIECLIKAVEEKPCSN